MKLSDEQLAALTALATGIIPADEIDGGAAPRIAAGIHTETYAQGLDAARSISLQEYGAEPSVLGVEDLDRLLGLLRERTPAFFFQLRMDVAALYLSDPDVWLRIGFPGPSTSSGGYPDFDRPQTEKIVRLKEAE